MNADTAIGKAIGELDWNKPDRAQVWALIAIAEAILSQNTPQDVSHVLRSHDEPDPAPHHQSEDDGPPYPRCQSVWQHAPRRIQCGQRLNHDGPHRLTINWLSSAPQSPTDAVSFEALFAPPRSPAPSRFKIDD